MLYYCFLTLNIERWSSLFKNYDLFLRGFMYTIVISVGAILVASAIGLVFGILSSTRNKHLRLISIAYVEFFQNTPLIMQVFFTYNVLPMFGIILSVELVGILCVGMYHGAYIAEVFRSGILSVPKGQFEASYSQGLSYLETMRYIILPQAIRVMLPPIANQGVNLIKNTSIVSIIAGADLLFTANSWAANNEFYLQSFVLIGLLYFCLCFPLATFARKIEIKNKKRYQ